MSMWKFLVGTNIEIVVGNFCRGPKVGCELKEEVKIAPNPLSKHCFGIGRALSIYPKKVLKINK